MITAKPKFDRVAQRCPSYDFYINPIAKTHLKQPTLNLAIPTNGYNRSMAADSELVHGARLNWPAVVATGKIAGFLHISLRLR